MDSDLLKVVVPFSKNKKVFVKNSLTKNAKCMLIIMKIIGMLPSCGIFTNDLHLARFSYFSWRALLTLCIIVGHGCMCLTYCVVFVNSAYDIQWSGTVTIIIMF